jgi:K+-transporting ATPase c subunit
VTTVEEANLVVNVTVTSYSRTAASYTGDQSITAYDVSITASVQAQDQVRDEEFYTGSVSAKTTYDPNASTGQSLSPEELALRRTVAKLAREAVRQVLTAW